MIDIIIFKYVLRFSLPLKNSNIQRDESISYSPEKLLWLNVIIRAYNDIKFGLESAPLLKNQKLAQQHYKFARDAANWILSSKESVQSFKWCVEYCFTDRTSSFVINMLRKIAISFRNSKKLPTKSSLFNKDIVT